ncbi:MAG: hypothetical protein HFE63_01510 [Clostridiales bacterium]|nr:hypothetical protein [Clostridiales bacterium]
MDSNINNQAESETRFTLRIDSEIFERIKYHAKKNKRSSAKQIEFILDEWLRNNDDKK